jgi:hypothetical protein
LPPPVTLNSGTASSVMAADAAARAAYQGGQTPTKTGIGSSAYLNQAIGEMQNRYDALAREVAMLQSSLQRAHQDEVAAGVAAAQRRVYTGPSTRARSLSGGRVCLWPSRKG